VTRTWQAVATVVAPVDGDTFHASLDIGWGITLQPRKLPRPGLGTVRVVFPDGRPYDAPETTTPRGKAAAAYIARQAPNGTLLDIVSYHLDPFGRTLAAVTLPNGDDWATHMTELGWTK
jgi:hypothetical protein